MYRNPLTVKDVEELKNKTEEGQFIKFFGVVKTIHPTGVIVSKHKDITGFVKEKFEHTFRLDNGIIYQWKDYALGYKY